MLDGAALDAHADAIARDGFTIVADAIEPDLVDALADDLARLEDLYSVVPADNSFEGSRTVRIYNLLALGRVYEAIPVHGQVLPLVERVLGDHPDVREAIAYGLPDERLGERLAVTVVLEPEAELGGDDIKSHCRRHLAIYKVPRNVYLTGDPLPRTASGKVDRGKFLKRVREAIAEAAQA